MPSKTYLVLLAVLLIAGGLFYSHTKMYKAGYNKATLQQAQADLDTISKRQILKVEISRLTNKEAMERLDRWYRD